MARRLFELTQEWKRLAGAGSGAATVGAELLARWAEPHRRYHTLDHLQAVLAAVDQLADAARDTVSVRYAAWFHDAVYQGEPGADEENSAQLAELLLPSCGLSADRVAEVARLVRVTAEHDPAPGDADAEVLCDADLSVLAADPDSYAAYTRAVRAEYAHVSDADFARGRAAVLHGLLETPRIYRTPRARERWEERARANLTRELAQLAEDPSGFTPSQSG